MDELDWQAERFEQNLAHLRAVAYRMLGSQSEADDAVQESWLRFSRADSAQVENLGGSPTTIVARVCLDMLRSRKARREEPLGLQVTEPIAGAGDSVDPERELLIADSVGMALLIVLDTLAPAERVAFVLHDMFAVPFDDVAAIVGRSPAAARQLASRARAGAFSGRARAARPALLGGIPGLVWTQGGTPRVAFGFTVADGKITRIDLIADPEHLRELDVVVGRS